MQKGEYIDISGKKFGRLSVTRFHSMRGRAPLFECLCDCWKVRICYGSHIRRGNTKSCGCLSRDNFIKARTIHGAAIGNNFTPEYKTWRSMRNRCLHNSSPEFKNYGGRGIKICKRWDVFKNFLADMGLKPVGDYSIERINTNGNYEPSNCRWATRIEQASNKSNNHFISFQGKTKTIAQWSRYLKFKPSKIQNRLRLGWGIGEILK